MTSQQAERAEENWDMIVGLNVHGLLYRRRQSQKELALRLGITPTVLSKKIRGEVAWSGRQIAESAEFLGVDKGRLFEPTVPKIGAKLRMIPGEGRDSLPRPARSLNSIRSLLASNVAPKPADNHMRYAR